MDEQRFRVVSTMVRFRAATPTPGDMSLGMRDSGRRQIISGSEIDPRDRQHLLSVGMIEPVDPTPAPAPAATG